MTGMTNNWAWRRWQLVQVEDADDGFLVDLIELDGDDTTVPGNLVTLTFRGSADPPERERAVRRDLEQWVRQRDGVCDAFHHESGPLGRLALFQGRGSIVVTTVAPARP
jgi:hypothetical protein